MDDFVTSVLARHVVETRRSPVTDEARQAVERAVLDWIGVALGGVRRPAAKALMTGLAPLSGPSRIVGIAASASPSVAALINGTAAHTLELDDIYAPGLFHPGAPVVAAALAVADQIGSTGEELIRAVLVGYEVGCRVAADLGPAHYAKWHTTGTAGAVASAAAAAELWQLGPDLFAHALGLSATMAAGLQQTFRRDAMGKPLHAGNAAQAGVVAAAAARGGVTAAGDVLEGEAGLGQATGSPSSWVASRGHFGDPWAIEQITVKPYPCCGHAFAAIDAALDLRDVAALTDIEAITVHTYRTAIDVAGILDPATESERRFSIPFVVDAAWRDGAVLEETFADAGSDPSQVPVQLVHDESFERAFPARRGARVTAVTRDGRELSSTVADRSGSPENPLSDEAIEAKYLAQASPVLGAAAHELLMAVRQLSDGTTVMGLPLQPNGFVSGSVDG